MSSNNDPPVPEASSASVASQPVDTSKASPSSSKDPFTGPAAVPNDKPFTFRWNPAPVARPHTERHTSSQSPSSAASSGTAPSLSLFSFQPDGTQTKWNQNPLIRLSAEKGKEYLNSNPFSPPIGELSKSTPASSPSASLEPTTPPQRPLRTPGADRQDSSSSSSRTESSSGSIFSMSPSPGTTRTESSPPAFFGSVTSQGRDIKQLFGSAFTPNAQNRPKFQFSALSVPGATAKTNQKPGQVIGSLFPIGTPNSLQAQTSSPSPTHRSLAANMRNMSIQEKQAFSPQPGKQTPLTPPQPSVQGVSNPLLRSQPTVDSTPDTKKSPKPYDISSEKVPQHAIFSSPVLNALREGHGIAKSCVELMEEMKALGDPSNGLESLSAEANDLTKFKNSVKQTVAILGDSGEGVYGLHTLFDHFTKTRTGKSSLINSLLHIPGIAKTVRIDLSNRPFACLMKHIE